MVLPIYIIIIPNTAVFGPTNFIETIPSTARMKISAEAEDFGWRFLWWPDGAIRKILFIYLFLLMISDEDFYGGRTGPLEKFNYYFIFLFFLFYFFFSFFF